MSKLSVTLIDVGCGDSILIEAQDANGGKVFGLVDSNDEPNWRSTETFLIRHLRSTNVTFDPSKRLFDFVMLSHAHSDHMSGLKHLLQTFGADWFYYPESGGSVEFGILMRYVVRSTSCPNGRVGKHQVVNQGTTLPPLNGVAFQVLWPPKTLAGRPYDQNENKNSVVLGMTLDKVKFLLTGDCEADCCSELWKSVTKKGLKFVKLPHHGAYNGFFDKDGIPVWRHRLNKSTLLGMSTHVSPYGHPDNSVLRDLANAGFLPGKGLLRTDQGYHITIETDGLRISAKHSRF
jgi:beta-lactamase superfamily II metal-dependent hydrolase